MVRWNEVAPSIHFNSHFDFLSVPRPNPTGRADRLPVLQDGHRDPGEIGGGVSSANVWLKFDGLTFCTVTCCRKAARSVSVVRWALIGAPRVALSKPSKSVHIARRRPGSFRRFSRTQRRPVGRRGVHHRQHRGQLANLLGQEFGRGQVRSRATLAMENEPLAATRAAIDKPTRIVAIRTSISEKPPSKFDG